MDRNSISQIRKELECCVGKQIQLRANKGRKKTFTRVGVVENVYPSIFTVRFDNEPTYARKVSYSYTDILTHTVEVKVMTPSLNNIAL